MPPKKKVGTSPEAAECGKTLGNPPPVPPQANVMNVSESLVKRINTGAVDEERRNAYDDYWLQKLACMDKAHSKNANLDLDEISKIETNLRQHVTGGKQCPLDRKRVTQCYVLNRNETLKCERDVETFLNCVDAQLYRSVRGSTEQGEPSKPSKRTSYANQFQRGH